MLQVLEVFEAQGSVHFTKFSPALRSAFCFSKAFAKLKAKELTAIGAN